MSLQKRPKRSFTPTSDDGDVVVPVTNEDDTGTPSPENTPLIRKPVGFTWTPSVSAQIETYEAPLPPKPPTAGYFLPGQAPPPPPKPPKQQKPKTNRKKKNQEYSSQTGRFRLMASTPGPSTMSPAPADFLTLTPSGRTGLAGVTPFHSSVAITGSPSGTLSSGSSAVATSSPHLSTHLPFSSPAMLTANGLTHYSREMEMHRSAPAPVQVSAGESLAPPRKRGKRGNTITEGTVPDVQGSDFLHYQHPQAATTGLAHASYNFRSSDNRAESTETIGSNRSLTHNNPDPQSNTACKKILPPASSQLIPGKLQLILIVQILNVR